MYQVREKDWVFIVSVEQKMQNHMEKVKKLARKLFTDYIEDMDRISLQICGSKTQTRFKLIPKTYNFVQLINQVKRIEATNEKESNICASICYAIKQFIEEP